MAKLIEKSRDGNIRLLSEGCELLASTYDSVLVSFVDSNKPPVGGCQAPVEIWAKEMVNVIESRPHLESNTLVLEIQSNEYDTDSQNDAWYANMVTISYLISTFMYYVRDGRQRGEFLRQLLENINNDPHLVQPSLVEVLIEMKIDKEIRDKKALVCDILKTNDEQTYLLKVLADKLNQREKRIDRERNQLDEQQVKLDERQRKFQSTLGKQENISDMLVTKENEVNEREAALEQREKLVKEATDELKEKNDQLEELQKRLDERDRYLKQREQKLADRENQLDEKLIVLEEKNVHLQRKEKELTDRDADFTARERELDKKQNYLDNLQKNREYIEASMSNSSSLTSSSSSGSSSPSSFIQIDSNRSEIICSSPSIIHSGYDGIIGRDNRPSSPSPVRYVDDSYFSQPLTPPRSPPHSLSSSSISSPTKEHSKNYSFNHDSKQSLPVFSYKEPLNQTGRLTKDGLPDMRDKNNRGHLVSKDGIRLKKDGTPDMRCKENQILFNKFRKDN